MGKRGSGKEHVVEKRRKLLQTAADPTSRLTVLERQSVRPRTEVSYKKRVGDFIRWSREQKVNWRTVEEMDAVLTEYIQHLFSEGVHRSITGHLYAGLAHYMALSTETARCSFPRALRAMKGWNRVEPDATRIPTPFVAMAAVVALLGHWGLHRMALCTVLAFHAYLRPGEVCGLRVSQLVPPAQRSGLTGWALLLHEATYGVTGKARIHDESVMVDWSVLFPMLQALVAGRPHGVFLWDFTVAQWRVQYAKAIARLGLDPAECALYALRHGGASSDWLEGRRDWNGVKLRGRWKSDATLKRYCKPAKLQQALNHLPRDVQIIGQWARENLQLAVLGRIPSQLSRMPQFVV
mmetsp:Transcript_47017/g.111915  ORF Transcript_47017/g.111915 Transcript_47017/m.111915 type:complete len:351 (+) Transcript_47017:256-1308(+)